MNTVNRQSLYSNTVLRCFERPQYVLADNQDVNAWIAAKSVFIAENATLVLYAKKTNSRVQSFSEVRFRALACPTTIAVGEWLSEQLSGAELTAAKKITSGEIREALDISADRTHCAFLGEDCVKSLVEQMERLSA